MKSVMTVAKAIMNKLSPALFEWATAYLLPLLANEKHCIGVEINTVKDRMKSNKVAID